jgi:hypothetical protein
VITVDGRFTGPCAQCGSQMWLPESLYTSAKHSQNITFYCPYGHPQIFPQGESTLTLVRRERDRLAQQIAQKEDEIRTQAKLITNLKAQRAIQTKKLKRVDKGVCPECNRSFENLQRHMHTKHHGALQ